MLNRYKVPAFFNFDTRLEKRHFAISPFLHFLYWLFFPFRRWNSLIRWSLHRKGFKKQRVVSGGFDGSSSASMDFKKMELNLLTNCTAGAYQFSFFMNRDKKSIPLVNYWRVLKEMQILISFSSFKARTCQAEIFRRNSAKLKYIIKNCIFKFFFQTCYNIVKIIGINQTKIK